MNETKQQLLELVDFDRMLEDLTYFWGGQCDLQEDEILEILDSFYNDKKFEDVFYESFKSVFKRKDSIQKYIQYQTKAIESQDLFTDYLSRQLIKEINQRVPDDRKIHEEGVH